MYCHLVEHYFDSYSAEICVVQNWLKFAEIVAFLHESCHEGFVSQTFVAHWIFESHCGLHYYSL